VTAKHVAITFLGLATAALGAWLTIKAPTAQGPVLLIALGGQVATGALALATPGVRRLLGASSEHTPVGFAGRD